MNATVSGILFSRSARPLLFVACLAGSAGIPISATPLFPGPVFDVGAFPISIARGDFNADGRPDLAVANGDSNDVSVLLGQGDGTFGPQTRFGAGDSPSHIAVGDFNGDGRPDLAVSNGGSSDVSIMLGQGDGTFGLQTRFGLGGFSGGPGCIAVGDFNADGHLDLVVADPYVSVLLGRGDGTFGSQTIFEAGNGPVSIVVGDFNADGRPDLAVTNWLSNDVSILLGQGDGNFGPQTRIGVGTGPIAITVGDFNGDGRPDLAVANGLANYNVINDISILLGRGDGTFDPQDDVLAGDRPTSIVVGDFNADGRQDLAVANQFSSDVSVLLGHGDGAFDPETRLGAGDRPVSIEVGDFNDDGRQDLAVANEHSNNVSVLLGQDDGTFGPQFRFGTGPQPNSLAVGDFNADGRPDLAVANSASDDVSVLLARGDGNLGPQTRFRVGTSPWSIAVGDFNADGRPDLAVANAHPYPFHSYGDVSILLGQGDGTFGPETRFGAGQEPRSIAVGDFNADGHLDLAVTNWVSNDVSILLGLGYGAFGPQTRFGAGRQPVSIVVRDFNADGYLDLAVPNRNSNDVSFLLGLGNGVFGSQTSFGTGSGPTSIAAGDFNADGRPDLAVMNGDSSDVSVLLGQGDGTFGAETRVGARSAPLSVTVGDFNADGRQDLAALSRHDVSILLLQGDGAFSLQSPFGAGASPSFIVAGDFNSDGRPDLAVANASFTYGSVTVLLNQGSLSKQPPVAVAKADARVECVSPSGAMLHLDGSASSDPDSAPGTNDDITSFQWFEDFATPSQALLGSGQRLTLMLGLGQHLLTLQVTDSEGTSATAQVTGTVVDTSPPALVCPSVGPVECSAPRGSTIVLMATATDVCSPMVAVTNNQTAGGADASGFHALGTTSTTFTATDATGNKASCTSSVLVRDTTPPSLAVAMSPATLWPPNRKLVPVRVAWQVNDVCDPAAGVILASVTSSEPAFAAGSGNTTADIQDASIGTPDTTVLLRAARSVGGPERLYALTYTATDESGNKTSALGSVAVAKPGHRP